MKGIKGQLSSLSITDLMQWIDMNKKSGVLFVTSDEQNKCFIFEEGRLLLASAREEGERFGDFVQKEGYMNLEGLKQAVKDGQNEDRSFIGIMIDKKVMPEQFVKVTVEHLAEKNIMDILGWEEGSFQFVEELPKLLRKSPIKLGINFITFEAVRKHDEHMKKRALEAD
ncbi:MAG: DUF4388 domain-containing protein [Thermodesulfovibrionales bacterium]|nr:DUF4388 domain-containing protein [Thermodesulfovibrionales bacterium]